MQGELIVLGSGTSMGVPTLGCLCSVCTSDDPRDNRTRPSVAIAFAGHVVLVDAGPDFRTQVLREKLTRVDAVLYTHSHADHILGLDDLRPLSFKQSPQPIPLYAAEPTATVIRRVFEYTFSTANNYAMKPKVELRPLEASTSLFGVQFLSIPLMHGQEHIFGFRFGNAAYLTDVSTIPEASFDLLRGLDTLIIDALRKQPHPTHANIDQATRYVDRIAPRQAFFTHIAHELGHAETDRELPPHIRLAYDGLRIPIEL